MNSRTKRIHAYDPSRPTLERVINATEHAIGQAL